MHLDIAHAAIAAVLILVVVFVLRQIGQGPERGKWSWPLFLGVFVVMLLLNLIWPY